MTHYKRFLDLVPLLEKKSFFLLGPRATGKSSLAKEQLGEQAIIINLLRSDLYLRLTAAPWELEAIIDAALTKRDDKIIVIDEIQKIPHLLDEVHRLIEERKLRFLLTGSSARKLKAGHANLLAGRAWSTHLYPLCYKEISNFDLDRYLRYGGLPAIYASNDPDEELHAYCQTYLYEEIQAEGLVRKLPQFSRFLTVAALANGHLLNFSQISNDAGVAASTIREYYRILEDTLIGFMLTPWGKSQKRKAIATAKFYFFDTGVTHALAQTQTLDRNSDLYGRTFEHWVGLELRSYLSYKRINLPLHYWQSTNKHEVDFLVDDQIAIEVKATKKITPNDLKGLKYLEEENQHQAFYVVSNDPIEAKYGKIHCIHWKTFAERLWADDLIKS
jgi:predicted AAA+ superfamily ATPase